MSPKEIMPGKKIKCLLSFRPGEERAVSQNVRHDDGAPRWRDDQSEVPGAQADHQVHMYVGLRVGNIHI